MMRSILIIFIFIIAGCADNNKKVTADPTETPVANNGELLFKNNCAACHKPDKDFTGPPLKGALQRWGGDKKAMYEFIRNPAGSIATNAYARELFEKWNKTTMTPCSLSEPELDSIMNYIEEHVNVAVPQVVVD